jgi:L-lactate dehydrogenase complex protein LldG
LPSTRHETPVLHNFLCDTHIVAVHANCIVPHLEDYAAARIFGDPAPRNVCLITGASGTTDIEGILVKGAHDPRELHIVVVDDSGQCNSVGAQS